MMKYEVLDKFFADTRRYFDLEEQGAQVCQTGPFSLTALHLRTPGRLGRRDAAGRPRDLPGTPGGSAAAFPEHWPRLLRRSGH